MASTVVIDGAMSGGGMFSGFDQVTKIRKRGVDKLTFTDYNADVIAEIYDVAAYVEESVGDILGDSPDRAACLFFGTYKTDRTCTQLTEAYHQDWWFKGPDKWQIRFRMEKEGNFGIRGEGGIKWYRKEFSETDEPLETPAVGLKEEHLVFLSKLNQVVARTVADKPYVKTADNQFFTKLWKKNLDDENEEPKERQMFALRTNGCINLPGWDVTDLLGAPLKPSLPVTGDIYFDTTDGGWGNQGIHGYDYDNAGNLWNSNSGGAITYYDGNAWVRLDMNMILGMLRGFSVNGEDGLAGFATKSGIPSVSASGQSKLQGKTIFLGSPAGTGATNYSGGILGSGAPSGSPTNGMYGASGSEPSIWTTPAPYTKYHYRYNYPCPFYHDGTKWIGNDVKKTWDSLYEIWQAIHQIKSTVDTAISSLVSANSLSSPSYSWPTHT